jgi:hypothetical protein
VVATSRLLNPASAFIKACKMLVDIVTFIVTRGAQIVQFVNVVLAAVIAIRSGGTDGIPALIENALAKSRYKSSSILVRV